MCDEINVKMIMPDAKYCTDNATMIGAAAYILYRKKEFATLDLNAKSTENLWFFVKDKYLTKNII